MRLYENIENIFQDDILEKIKEMVNNFHNMSLDKFYLKYGDELDLQNCPWVEDFMNMKDGSYINEHSDENRKIDDEYKDDYLDLLVLWSMEIYNLGLLIEESKMQSSEDIAERINYILEDLDAEIIDNFSQDVIIEGFIQDINSQLKEENMKFIKAKIKDSIDTYYFFLFKNDIADKLINDYNNQFFSFKEISCDDYICSFYIADEIKRNFLYFGYKNIISTALSSEIEYLLKQRIRNFIISCISDMDLMILKIFEIVSKEYDDINLECYMFKKYKCSQHKELLKNISKFNYLQDNSNESINKCFKNILKKSTLNIYFGYTEKAGVIRKRIIENDYLY